MYRADPNVTNGAVIHGIRMPPVDDDQGRFSSGSQECRFWPQLMVHNVHYDGSLEGWATARIEPPPRG